MFFIYIYLRHVFRFMDDLITLTDNDEFMISEEGYFERPKVLQFFKAVQHMVIL